MAKSEIYNLCDPAPPHLIGNKAAQFHKLKQLGLSYPAGIVITKSLAADFLQNPGQRKTIIALITKQLEQQGISLKTDSVSVRSSPIFSMPGRLRSVLDIQGPQALEEAITAVAQSWFSQSAADYRETAYLSHDFNQGIIIQKMIAPDPDSIAGVYTTRNPNTGKDALHGHIVMGRSGDSLMDSAAAGYPLGRLQTSHPQYYELLIRAKTLLEQEYKFPQEIEFVIKDGKVYFLQTRDMTLTPQATVYLLHDLVAHKVIPEFRLITYLEKLQLTMNQRVLMKLKDGIQPQHYLSALTSTQGALQGALFSDITSAEQTLEAGKPAILVATMENREQVLSLLFKYPAVGLITLYGNDSSHESVLTRQAGIPALINIQGLTITPNGELIMRDKVIPQGKIAVIDATGNRFFMEPAAAVEPDTIVEDASFGIDIKAETQQLFSQFLDTAGQFKPGITFDYIQALNDAAFEECKDAEAGTDKRRIFTTNLRKHILHQLLIMASRHFKRPLEDAQRKQPGESPQSPDNSVQIGSYSYTVFVGAKISRQDEMVGLFYKRIAEHILIMLVGLGIKAEYSVKNVTYDDNSSHDHDLKNYHVDTYFIKVDDPKYIAAAEAIVTGTKEDILTMLLSRGLLLSDAEKAYLNHIRKYPADDAVVSGTEIVTFITETFDIPLLRPGHIYFTGLFDAVKDRSSDQKQAAIDTYQALRAFMPSLIENKEFYEWFQLQMSLCGNFLESDEQNILLTIESILGGQKPRDDILEELHHFIKTRGGSLSPQVLCSIADTALAYLDEAETVDNADLLALCIDLTLQASTNKDYEFLTRVVLKITDHSQYKARNTALRALWFDMVKEEKYSQLAEILHIIEKNTQNTRYIQSLLAYFIKDLLDSPYAARVPVVYEHIKPFIPVSADFLELYIALGELDTAESLLLDILDKESRASHPVKSYNSSSFAPPDGLLPYAKASAHKEGFAAAIKRLDRISQREQQNPLVRQYGSASGVQQVKEELAIEMGKFDEAERIIFTNLLLHHINKTTDTAQKLAVTALPQEGLAACIEHSSFIYGYLSSSLHEMREIVETAARNMLRTRGIAATQSYLEQIAALERAVWEKQLSIKPTLPRFSSPTRSGLNIGASVKTIKGRSFQLSLETMLIEDLHSAA